MFEILDNVTQRYPDKAETGLPISKDKIASLEAILNNKFPDSYKIFLERWGWLEFGSYHYLGVIDSDLYNPSGVVQYNIDEREKGRLPNDFLIVKDEGDYGEICLDLREGLNSKNECQIILWDPWNKKVLDIVSNSFEEFLTNDISNYLENVM